MFNGKKLLIAALGTLVIAASSFAQEQKDKSSKSKTESKQEIIIKKNGKNPEKMTIVVDGDIVTINGKPVEEFENNNIIIMKKGIDRKKLLARQKELENSDLDLYENLDLALDLNKIGNKARLGVLTEKTDGGVKINFLTKNSSAQKAGLKEGDVITKVNSSIVTTPKELIDEIKKHKPKDKVNIVYKRDGKENSATATLGENINSAYSFNMKGLNGEDFSQLMPNGQFPGMENFNFDFMNKPKIGLQIQDVEEGSGVKVKEVDEDTPAAKAGLKEGDIITQVNGKDIVGVDEMKEAIKELKAGDSIKLTYKRNGASETADIKIPKKLKTVDL